LQDTPQTLRRQQHHLKDNKDMASYSSIKPSSTFGTVAANSYIRSTVNSNTISNLIPTTKVYVTAEELPALNNKVGDRAYVQESSRFFIWTGVGWYNIALVNTTPTWDAGGQPSASYELDSQNGNPIIINLAASDPEGLPITYSYLLSDSAQYLANFIQDSSQITVISKSKDSVASVYDSYGPFTFTSTFRASDGINYLSRNSEFTLQFGLPTTTIVTDGSTTWDLSTTDIVLSTAQVKNLSWDTNFHLAPISIKMWGAGGGGTNWPYAGKGGGGGFSSGVITWDDTLGVSEISIVVGGRGREGNIVPSGGTPGGGGNGGGTNTYGNAGGGGFTGIFKGSSYTNQTDALMIAGGGGGASNASQENAGGGTEGQSGSSTQSGDGGTQSAGGAGGVGGSATGSAGSALQGGTGGTANGTYTGAGGGGGYFGGGGGGHTTSSYLGAGGGGSGYLHPTYVTNGTTTAGSYEVPANNTDADRGTAGQGANNGSDNATDGKIIISLAP